MSEYKFSGTMKHGRLYSDDGQYHGELLRGGNSIKRQIYQDNKTGVYSQPGIYGFVDTKGDTSYFEHTATSKSMSNLADKGRLAFRGAVQTGFNPEYMKRRGISKLDIPEGMDIDKYDRRYFSKGKKPSDAKGIKKIFNYLKGNR
tara:strand:+ start:1154 stop:1588 length:435 start_codon:yes stop_codon:yes gene_type:complete